MQLLCQRVSQLGFGLLRLSSLTFVFDFQNINATTILQVINLRSSFKYFTSNNAKTRIHVQRVEYTTRMHFSRMRTARPLTVSRSICRGGLHAWGRGCVPRGACMPRGHVCRGGHTSPPPREQND